MTDEASVARLPCGCPLDSECTGHHDSAYGLADGRTEADVVRRVHFGDRTLSNEDFGRMVEEADERDLDREARAELSDEADERLLAAVDGGDVVDLGEERQYREEFRSGRDPRD